jgi:2-phosphosulfolactate phosphatase
MRLHVAFMPAEVAESPVAVVVDIMRATSVIAQALASGYRRVLCCAEIDDALELRASLDEPAVLGGERDAVLIEGFDAGASPREYLEPRAETLILSTTNGTRAILTAAAHCGEVLLGSMLNLDALAATLRRRDEHATVICAGFQGAFAIDDAYCAGRIVALVEGERTDAAKAAEVIAHAYPRAIDGINARTYGPPGLEEDIAWCSQVGVLDVVPRFTRMVGKAAEIATV